MKALRIGSRMKVFLSHSTKDKQFVQTLAYEWRHNRYLSNRKHHRHQDSGVNSIGFRPDHSVARVEDRDIEETSRLVRSANDRSSHRKRSAQRPYVAGENAQAHDLDRYRSWE
jgi:hypothetical protein